MLVSERWVKVFAAPRIQHSMLYVQIINVNIYILRWEHTQKLYTRIIKLAFWISLVNPSGVISWAKDRQQIMQIVGSTEKKKIIILRGWAAVNRISFRMISTYST